MHVCALHLQLHATCVQSEGGGRVRESEKSRGRTAAREMRARRLHAPRCRCRCHVLSFLPARLFVNVCNVDPPAAALVLAIDNVQSLHYLYIIYTCMQPCTFLHAHLFVNVCNVDGPAAALDLVLAARHELLGDRNNRCLGLHHPQRQPAKHDARARHGLQRRGVGFRV
eukprot:356305-Chlamydomonas_euryale.AAC.1